MSCCSNHNRTKGYYFLVPSYIEHIVITRQTNKRVKTRQKSQNGALMAPKIIDKNSTTIIKTATAITNIIKNPKAFIVNPPFVYLYIVINDKKISR